MECKLPVYKAREQQPLAMFNLSRRKELAQKQQGRESLAREGDRGGPVSRPQRQFPRRRPQDSDDDDPAAARRQCDADRLDVEGRQGADALAHSWAGSSSGEGQKAARQKLKASCGRC